MSDKRRRSVSGAQKKTKAPVAAPAGAGSPAGGAAGGASRVNRGLWFAAFVLVIVGYALLLRAGPGGQGLLAMAAPALLLAGYLLVIPAILATYRS